ncbi:4Fe-4S dicluster domain-containing protein [Desulfosoma caldarium]|uniref:2-oxoglutarate ferredoxin oxidoreductase subunit delta n=1 Tax=Desulfosoma caldarium TaxID=610254 RepID=A0A3N1UPT5_9BACT|nr:4Fe-4S binding protein [Desulfosoma caldarium]ROQ92083.1 2-oxoglutarate ferredoxin oxidoreductase subunit delta [Desulfosoma caldarium]
MAENTESSKQRKTKASQAVQEPTTAKPQELEASEVATSEAEEREKPKRFFDIAIFLGWCKGCGICAAFCPRECIAMGEDGYPAVKDSDRCTGCGFCEIHCPDFAISVRARKKVSSHED